MDGIETEEFTPFLNLHLAPLLGPSGGVSSSDLVARDPGAVWFVIAISTRASDLL
jgi:hypothetical protein